MTRALEIAAPRAARRLLWFRRRGDEPGPVGEYVEVVDVDPASGVFYYPVELDHPHLLAKDGLSPSESNPQFHQQMVYAVAMTTIQHFERALGRPVSDDELERVSQMMPPVDRVVCASTIASVRSGSSARHHMMIASKTSSTSSGASAATRR